MSKKNNLGLAFLLYSFFSLMIVLIGVIYSHKKID